MLITATSFQITITEPKTRKIILRETLSNEGAAFDRLDVLEAQYGHRYAVEYKANLKRGA